MPIQTRFLLLSDTHNAPLYAPDAPYAFRSPLPSADVLIHAGDLTMTGEPGEHETTFALLRGAPAPLKLVIAGNHDLSLDAAFVARAHPAAAPGLRAALAHASALWTGPAARAAGIHLLSEGVHDFTLASGARLRVYASPFTPEFFDWAFMYPRASDRFNPGADAVHPIPDGVDVVVTHGPPATHLGQTTTGVDAGCEHLLRAIERVRPALHVFGHIHEAWGARRVDWAAGSHDDVAVDAARAAREQGVVVDAGPRGGVPLQRGRHSLLVNASIMTLAYRPRQSPWLVDLELPGARDGERI